MSWTLFSVATTAAGAALWLTTVALLIRGRRGMTRMHIALTLIVLLAAPVALVVVLR